MEITGQFIKVNSVLPSYFKARSLLGLLHCYLAFKRLLQLPNLRESATLLPSLPASAILLPTFEHLLHCYLAFERLLHCYLAFKHLLHCYLAFTCLLHCYLAFECLGTLLPSLPASGKFRLPVGMLEL